MMAQGEIVGVLHLQSHSEESSSDMGETENITQITALSKTVGERVALAIANLRLQEILRNQSIRDPLTGLFNRRYLEETLEREIHRAVREQYPLGVIFMDIDHFKLFNDTYSHDVGDAVLRKLGEFLSTHVRYGDISCRYGGDEFVIVLPDASLEITKQRAEDIRSGVKYIKMEYRGAVIQNITLSLGVSAIPEIEASSEILLQAADAALRQAKAEGRDKVLVAQTAG
jgi:diguanylate cyclase (GGDEF)-like protein